ncbi:MAG: iron dependent repressor, metal binding and dimerization domain protein [Verrucomicrobiia bacterium]
MDEERAKLNLSKDERILAEDLLKVLFQIEYDSKSPDLPSIAGRLGIHQDAVIKLITYLTEIGYVRRSYDLFYLTEAGRKFGLEIVRAHRICETYLARETGVSPKEWHQQAHEMEHRLSFDEINKLSDKLGHPRFDPHGDPIPTRDGKIPSISGIPLAEWEVGKEAIVLHIEDEPDLIYNRLVAAGIMAGVRLKILKKTEAFLDILAEGKPIRLNIEDGFQVLVAPLPEELKEETGVIRLSDLKKGESAIVKGLMPSCTGLERLRLLDMGIVNGSRIRYEFASPFGSPVTYSVRGTLVALRREQADNILVVRESDDVKP